MERLIWLNDYLTAKLAKLRQNAVFCHLIIMQ